MSGYALVLRLAALLLEHPSRELLDATPALREAALTLLRAGAGRVDLWVLARTGTD